MPSADEPVRALRRLLLTDPGFAAEPRRLGRGLLDLLPYDDRAARLLTVAAELGVPALVTAGRLAEARQALTEHAGLQPAAAAWTVDVWRAAGTDEQASGFGPVRLAGRPDGSLLVVTREDRGVFAATVGRSGPEPWRLLAPAAGPGNLAVSADGERLVVAWPQTEGVYAVEATGGAPELVAETRTRLTPRTPFAVLAVDETLHHLVWAADGGRLRRGTWRAWPSDDPDEELPPVGEEVTGLDIGRSTPDAARLVALTGRGRVLTAHWDVPGEQVAAWRPVAVAAVAVAAAGARVFAATADGTIVGDDGEVVRPASGERLVAATVAAGTAWLATVAADTMTLSRPGSGAVWSLPAP